jgi:hypothetical protein
MSTQQNSYLITAGSFCQVNAVGIRS